MEKLKHRHPINKPYHVSSRFGPRSNEWHYGCDYAPEQGNEGTLHAVSTGIVAREDWHDLSGWYIWIRFDFIDGRTWRGLYAHMADRSPLKAGGRVDVGQWVGNIGSTGNSTGPHLHFEVIDDIGIHRDPEMWLENLRLISRNRELESR